jgi:hypothetical protein
MIYENVLSVAFIYAMGVYRGRTADPEQLIADSINFYQQTPNDPTIGDLMAHWNAKMFTIEFKRTHKQLSLETEKVTKANLFLALNKDKAMVKLSARGHFIGYGQHEKQETKTIADLIFKPYITLIFEDSKPGDRFNAFIQKFAGEKDFGWNKEQVDKYLKFLKQNVPATVTDSKTGSSGGRRVKATERVVTIISPAPDSKVLTLTFKSHLELHLLMKQKITLSKYLDLQIEQSQKIGSSIEVKEEPKINRGMGGLS